MGRKGALAALGATILLLSLLLPPWAGAFSSSTVDVVVSSEIRPYIEALNGLRDLLKRPMRVFYLKENHRLIARQLNEDPTAPVVLIGPGAARFVEEGEVDPRRSVVLMVLDPPPRVKGVELCGIDLRIPIETQLSAMARRLGRGSRIGVLYDRNENQALIARSQEVAREIGLTILPLPVTSREEVRERLQSALGDLDGLWFVPDSTVISEAVVGWLIKEALLHGVAPVGYNHFFMEKGAVMSFTVDYAGVGRQGAMAVERLMKGQGCGMSPPPFRVEWNEKAWRLVQERRSLR